MVCCSNPTHQQSTIYKIYLYTVHVLSVEDYIFCQLVSVYCYDYVTILIIHRRLAKYRYIKMSWLNMFEYSALCAEFWAMNVRIWTISRIWCWEQCFEQTKDRANHYKNHRRGYKTILGSWYFSKYCCWQKVDKCKLRKSSDFYVLSSLVFI